jgi:hypothetical protein
VSAELQEFLTDHPDIDAVQLLLTDPPGVLRGKIILHHELDALYASWPCPVGQIRLISPTSSVYLAPTNPLPSDHLQ